MKTLAGIVLFVLMGISVNGQQTPAAKIMAETTVMSEKIVKGSPFSADAVNESVQVLADGNRIVHSSTNKLYRNSEGRFRREISGGSGGSFSSFYTVGPGITILDPVGGYRYLLDSHLRTARVGLLNKLYSLGGRAGTPAPMVRVAPSQAAIADRVSAEVKAATTIDPAVEEKMRAELKQAAVELKQAASELDRAKGELKAMAPLAVITTKEPSEIVSAYQGSFSYAPSFKSKYETRNEDLGVQTIEGVEAVGTRTITTIPAGEIGNERPIEMVYERWYSNELQLVVMSKNSDPRFGEQTYRLTNIVRSEPDPTLFELPAGYKVVSEKAGNYKISTAGPAQGAIWTKAGGGGVATTKPAKP